MITTWHDVGFLVVYAVLLAFAVLVFKAFREPILRRRARLNVTKPTGVLIHHVDGTSTEPELIYQGWDDMAMTHNWFIDYEFAQLDNFTIEVLPAHTGVTGRFKS